MFFTGKVLLLLSDQIFALGLITQHLLHRLTRPMQASVLVDLIFALNCTQLLFGVLCES